MALASLLAALAADTAAATFPGRNGLVAFASDRHPLLQHPQIFDLRVGGRPRNLSASADADYDAAPSPNGKLIAFAREGARAAVASG